MQHSEELSEYRRQYKAIKQDVRELVAGMDEERLRWRPAPGRWSISENLLHLNLVGERYIKAIDECVARARACGLFSRGPFRYGFFPELLVRSMEPPACRKFRTPPAMQPAAPQAGAEVMPAFLHLQDQLAERLEHAEGLDLKRATLVSPLMRTVRHALGLAFAFVAAHERRHLWQAREVRNHPAFALPER